MVCFAYTNPRAILGDEAINNMKPTSESLRDLLIQCGSNIAIVIACVAGGIVY